MLIDGSFVSTTAKAAKVIGKHKSVLEELVKIGYLGYYNGRNNSRVFSNEALYKLISETTHPNFPFNIPAKYRKHFMRLFPKKEFSQLKSHSFKNLGSAKQSGIKIKRST